VPSTLSGNGSVAESCANVSLLQIAAPPLQVPHFSPKEFLAMYSIEVNLALGGKSKKKYLASLGLTT
jgi:hypothetical protein